MLDQVKRAKSTTIDEYFEDGRSWEYDRIGQMRTSRNRAWILAAAFAVLAFMALGSLFALMPLKQFEPYVITVDKTTGHLEMARGLQAGPLTQDEALTQSLLVRYVTAREGYFPALNPQNYEQVVLWSETEALDQYQQAWSQSNPNNPAKVLGADTNIRTEIRGVSFLNDRTASVRFKRIQTERGRSQTSHWAAIVNFRFVETPTRMLERFQNPLGFQVSSYRLDQETLVE